MSKKIPNKESDLIALVELMIGGLKAEAKILKNPPLTIEELADSINAVNLAVEKVALKKADYHQAVSEKNKEVDNLFNDASNTAKFCYRIANNDKTILGKMGLTPRSEKKPVEPPGQCRNFAILKQEINSLTFHWKEPVSGGPIRVYIIQRKESEQPGNNWMNLWTEIGKKAEIKDHPQNKSFDYRVRALNASGIGEASNIVTLKF